LSLDVGPTAHDPVRQTVVTELSRFCRNSIQC
jgi:hypothetical protein